jgi:hypothetical protein
MLSPLANTLIANAKAVIRGTYHHACFAKYRDRDLAEPQCSDSERLDAHSRVGSLVYATSHSRPPWVN